MPVCRLEWTNVHVGGELAKSLVQVIHLRQNTSDCYDYEYVCRRVCELILALKSHFESNTECLDGHDGDGSSGGTDGQVDERILAAVFWCDFVDHEDGEDGDKGAVHEKS